MTEKTLGRGLSAFLDLENALENGDTATQTITNLNISKISPNPYQPRRTFNEENLRSLAASIKQSGVLQPILVKKISDNDYQLVAGERRFRASKIAGLSEIPAIITEVNNKEQLEIAILENIQREDLNPIDEAEGYKRLIDEFHYTQEQLSEILGKSRSHITNMLRLLTLPEKIQDHVRIGDITFGHARAIIGLEDAPKIAEKIISESMSVRDTEELARDMKQRKYRLNLNEKYTDPEILNISNQISSLLGLNVNVKIRGSGGVVEVEFKNFTELDDFVRKLNTLK